MSVRSLSTQEQVAGIALGEPRTVPPPRSSSALQGQATLFFLRPFGLSEWRGPNLRAT